MPDVPVRVALIRKMHLFRGLSDSQLNSVAEAMQEQTFDEAGVVFLQGSNTETFYIIFSGGVEVFLSHPKGEKKLAPLYRGDYFGEVSLLKGRTHSATVRAHKGTVLLKIYRDKFKELLNTIPDLRENFRIMMKSRELTRQKRFPWLNNNEVVYFLSRRHEFLLYQQMIGPILSLLVILAAISLGFLLQSVAVAGVSGFFLVLILLWGAWIYIDWNNDFYVVTNQRVVVIQKVVAMYDSREEALMGTILSVNTETDAFGRIFKYGTIVVRTFTGEVRMNHAPSPKQAATMIEEYWLRSKEVIRQNDEEIMKNAIRRKLGITPPANAQAAAPAPSAPKAPAAKPGLGGAIGEYLREIFYVRKIEGDTVTYHKHWAVLIHHTTIQSLALIALIAVYPLWYYFFEAFIPLALGSLVVFLIVADLVWWVYGFLDWRNDLYQVTAEQIVDIYRVPFGDEDRKSAPLENILSTQYKRAGFWGLLFNYGVVNIQVGGTTFDFADVADPPSVQKDIVERMNRRLQKKREADTAAERERMAEWLALYHRTMSDIEKQAGQNRSPNPG